jgi:hypothetical protein
MRTPPSRRYRAFRSWASAVSSSRRLTSVSVEPPEIPQASDLNAVRPVIEQLAIELATAAADRREVGRGQPLSGRESARKALYQRLTKDVEVRSKWPLGFETGTWEGHLGTIAGPTVIGGRYSAQWVKRGDVIAAGLDSVPRRILWR